MHWDSQLNLTNNAVLSISQVALSLSAMQKIKQSDDWFQIELASGEVGWCHKCVLERRN